MRRRGGAQAPLLLRSPACPCLHVCGVLVSLGHHHTDNSLLAVSGFPFSHITNYSLGKLYLNGSVDLSSKIRFAFNAVAM